MGDVITQTRRWGIIPAVGDMDACHKVNSDGFFLVLGMYYQMSSRRVRYLKRTVFVLCLQAGKRSELPGSL